MENHVLLRDRSDGGRRLAAELERFRGNPDAIIVALPRGGVVTGCEIARVLGLPLDIVVPRKIGAPYHPELAVGAVTEDGTVFLNEDLMERLGISEEELLDTIVAERKEAQRRLQVYRGDKEPLDLNGKATILVDDGIATGATMRAAIVSARQHGTSEIVVAVPVLPMDTLDQIRSEVDDVVYLAVPSYFTAVGAYYEYFSQTTDEEVCTILQQMELS